MLGPTVDISQSYLGINEHNCGQNKNNRPVLQITNTFIYTYDPEAAFCFAEFRQISTDFQRMLCIISFSFVAAALTSQCSWFSDANGTFGGPGLS